MRVITTDVDGAEHATGTVVVIDVIRAFTTAAVALDVGAARIVCVEHLEEAHGLRRRLGPDTVLMGEERGLRPDGFDLGNETDGPTAALVAGHTVVQRTSNGTRGLIRAGAATYQLAAAAVTAGATARWIAVHAPDDPVTLVTTGATSEDGAVAEHITELLRRGTGDGPALATQVRAAQDEHVRLWQRARDGVEFAAFRDDVARCAEVDRYATALVARADDDVAGRPVLSAVPALGWPTWAGAVGL